MQNNFLSPRVIVLREGTDECKGKSHLLSNINACIAIADVVRSTLGPRGMDKLIVDTENNITITNDGATIMKLLDVVHPVAKNLVDIATSQDSEVGDGTTTVVLLASEFLREAQSFIEEGSHPMALINGFRNGRQLAVAYIHKLSIRLSTKNGSMNPKLLEKCAMTSMNSKLISGEKDFFAKMVMDALCEWDKPPLDSKMVGIKKIQGGSLRDSILINGVAFKKTFSYAGFEKQPKYLLNPTVLLLNIELELKAEKSDAEIRLNDPNQYQSIVDAEWKILFDKLESCARLGANIILSRLAIGDFATQYFAYQNIFCAGRVTEDDLSRISEATGAKVQRTVSEIPDSILGTCTTFEERAIGNERYNLFTGCPNARTVTMILRGGAEQYIDEVARSLHDAFMVVRRIIDKPQVVPGGGAIDMELSKRIRDDSWRIGGKSQLFIAAYAKALEIIPRQLCDNSGFDSTTILNKLRQKHNLPEGKGRNFGIDAYSGDVCDTYKSFIWEASLIRINSLNAATEALCQVLCIDETIKNPPSEETRKHSGSPHSDQNSTKSRVLSRESNRY